MDTLTHALLGGTVVRAAHGRCTGWSRIDPLRATLVGAGAAAFPDIDYLSFWLDPLSFLADWHRGATHSLLLAPLWALALGSASAWLLRDRVHTRGYIGLCLAGVLSHIAADLITVYGTGILVPLSDWRPGLGITFVIDPYFSAIVVAGLTMSLVLGRPRWARIGLLVLGLYLGLQAVLQQQAKSIGEAYLQRQQLEQATSHAVAQPLSPFNWLVIVSSGETYHVARIHLATRDEQPPATGMGWLGRLWSAYRTPRALQWQRHSRFGLPGPEQALVRSAWQAPGFSRFRRFARLPALYRVDRHPGETCVWFTDLRYRLPGLIPPFRYGMCGSGDGDNWKLYRLRRSTYDARQALDD